MSIILFTFHNAQLFLFDWQVKLQCLMTGIPQPLLVWLKDSSMLVPMSFIQVLVIIVSPSFIVICSRYFPIVFERSMWKDEVKG